MIAEFKEFVKKNNLVQADGKILLSVSGGIDSMVMTHLFHRAGFDFDIVHCNFSLRGKDADEDELFVQEYAHSRQIGFYSRKFKTSEYARVNKISIQMAARELRVDWCEQLVAKHGFYSYATAHHLNDQIETLFINLFRGTGIAGIHGILPRTGNLVHPMMFTWKKDIIRYARVKRIPYRLDKSNLESEYERNAVRNKLIPVIREFSPGFEMNITRSIESFRQAEIIYRKRIDEVSIQLFEQIEGRTAINILKLKKLEAPFTFLFEMLSGFYFNRSVISDIHRSLDGESGKIFFSPSHRLVIDRNYLLIEPVEAEEKDESIWIYKDDPNLEQPLKLTLSAFEKPDGLVFTDDKQTALIDLDLINFPLQLRKWKQGDQFYPLGMKNRKLLSDYFIDNKFSVFQKKNIWLLISAGEIVWIIGHRLDDRFKITDTTRNILKVKLMNEKQP